MVISMELPLVKSEFVHNVDFSLTGKNVDVIIQDSGIQQYHPEFIDGNGQSRVSDIVLDGYILLILLILILTVSHIQKQMEELESLQPQHMNGGRTHQKDQDHSHR